MKKDIGIKFIIIFLILSCSMFCSCKNDDDFNLEMYNELFFSEFTKDYTWTKKYDDRYVDVSKIDLYYLDEHYYYEINFYDSRDDFEYEWLVIYWYGSQDIRFSIKNPDRNMKYFPGDYYDFLKAKENGVCKIYSKEEIDELLKKYWTKSGE